MPDALAILTTAIATRETALRTSILGDRAAALVALVRAQDRLLDSLDLTQTPPFDLTHGSRPANPGGNLALSLTFAATDPAPRDRGNATATGAVAAWADVVLTACADLADAKQVLAHLTSGFMRGGGGVQPDGSLHVWIAQKRFPPAWRERIDLAGLDARARRLSPDAGPAANAAQLGYLPDAIIAGLPARVWTGAVQMLATRYGEATSPIPEAEARDALTEALQVGPETAASILAALTLDAENAAWHAAVPGIAAAPFVRLTPTLLMPSRFGLRTEPLRFLARDLRRRDAQGWHNAAHQRETAFRHDLATIFADARFVHAPARIQLKREGGTLRTDIDAAIFDRKTGTLAVFELKAQDPFSRTPEELERRRDSVLAANR